MRSVCRRARSPLRLDPALAVAIARGGSGRPARRPAPRLQPFSSIPTEAALRLQTTAHAPPADHKHQDPTNPRATDATRAASANRPPLPIQPLKRSDRAELRRRRTPRPRPRPRQPSQLRQFAGAQLGVTLGHRSSSTRGRFVEFTIRAEALGGHFPFSNSYPSLPYPLPRDPARRRREGRALFVMGDARSWDRRLWGRPVEPRAA
jgi:hypothetical protein